MSIPKKQHFVPQSYLQQWEDKESLIWLYNKKDKTVAHRNTSSFFYYLHLYSLTLLEFNYLTIQQQETFFEPLRPFSVYLNDKKLTINEIMESMEHYNDFIIKNSEEKVISRGQKEDLLEKILTNKHFLIEERYSEIENEWLDVVDFFENYRIKVIQNNTDFPDANVFMKHTSKLLKFILSTYTRNPYNFNQILDRVEEKHNFMLNEWDARTIFEKIQLQHLSNEQHLFEIEDYDLHLIIAIPETSFLTCDNPVMMKGITIEGAGFTGIFWFPISPNILVALSKKQDRKKVIIKPYIAVEETVKKLNDIICQHAEECFVSCDNIKNGYKFINN